MSWSGSVGVPGSLASSRRWNQRGRSISTASNAVAMLAFARSISSAVSRFRCPRCACSGAPAMNATIDSTDSPSPTVRILPSWSRVRLPVPGGLAREKLGVAHVGPAQRHLLPLAPRQLYAAVEAAAEHLVVALPEPGGDRVGEAAARGLADPRLVAQLLHLAHPDVLLEDEVVAHEVLE